MANQSRHFLFAGILLSFVPGHLEGASPSRGFIVGRVVEVDGRGETLGPVPDLAVLLVGARYLEQARTDEHGEFTQEVDVGEWDLNPPRGYIVRSEPNHVNVKDQGRSLVVDSPTKLLQVTRQHARVWAEIVLVVSRSETPDTPASPNCPDPDAHPVPGRDFRDRMLKICGTEGSVSLYALPSTDSHRSITLLSTARHEGSGIQRLSLTPVNQSPEDLFVVSSWQTGHIPATRILSRADLAGLLNLQQGLLSAAPRRYGEFEEPGAEQNEQDASRRAVFPPHLMEALPLQDFRSFDQLALLAPGVLPPPQTWATSGPGISPGVGTSGQFSVNGARSRENNFITDGSDNNDEEVGTRRQGFVVPAAQSIESLREFQIITALADARFGRNIGGQVSTLAKTGQSNLHGTLYGFATDKRVNARNYFDEGSSAVPGDSVLIDNNLYTPFSPAHGATPFTRTQFGGVLDGPLRFGSGPLNTFFTVALEKLQTRATDQQHFNVPTVQQRGIGNTGTTGIQIGSTPIYPTSLVGDAILSVFPFPNDPIGPYGRNTYTTFAPADQDGLLFSAKGEHIFNVGRSRNFLTLGLDGTNETTAIPSVEGALFSTMFPKFTTQDSVLFFTTELSTGLINTFRTSWGHTRGRFSHSLDPFLQNSSEFPGDVYLLNAPLLLNVTSPSHPASTPVYVSGASAAGQQLINFLGGSGLPATVPYSDIITGPLGEINILGFSPAGVDPAHFPQSRDDQTFQWNDGLTLIRRKFTLMTGFDIRRVALDSTVEQGKRPLAVFGGLDRLPGPTIPNLPPSVAFPQILPASDLAAAGIPAGVFQTLSSQPNYALNLHKVEADFYAHLNAQVRPGLSISAGIRVETARLPEGISQQLVSGFDIASLKQQVAATEESTACNANCQAHLNDLVSKFPADFNNTFGADQLRADARLGLAWRPAAVPKMAVRAGFGSYSGQFPAIILSEARTPFPDYVSLNYAGPFTETFPSLLWNPANPYLTKILQADFHESVVAPGTLNIIAPQSGATGAGVQNAVNLIGLSTSAIDNVNPGLILTQPAAGLRSPSAFQYGFTLEYAFTPQVAAALAYVGTIGRHLLSVTTPDLGLNQSSIYYENFSRTGVAFPYINAVTLSPQAQDLGPILPISRFLFDGSASSSYNSLQAEIKRRFTSGVQFGGAFTYSHAIDNASDFFDLAGAYALPQDSIHPSDESLLHATMRGFDSHFPPLGLGSVRDQEVGRLAAQ